MIRNRYNYPTKAPKETKDALKATAPQSKHNNQKAKREGFFFFQKKKANGYLK